MTNFIACDILRNRPLWKDAISWMENNGGFVPPVVKDAVETGFFDLRHKSFTNFNANNIVFRTAMIM